MNSLRAERKGSRGFTLFELMVVIAIVAILAIAAILFLNPAELLEQARDTRRLDDVRTIEKMVLAYIDNKGNPPPGNSSTTYFSLVDPAATTTAGTDCSGLPLYPPAGWTYHCAASSTVGKMNGLGWLPISSSDLSSSMGSALPIDPYNTSSTNYYSYSRENNLWGVNAILESTRYISSTAQTDNGINGMKYETGDSRVFVDSDGLELYWKFSEGRGSTTADLSGNGNTGTFVGGASWVGGGVRLNGTDAEVTAADSPSLEINGDLTITMQMAALSVGSNRYFAYKDQLNEMSFYMNGNGALLFANGNNSVSEIMTISPNNTVTVSTGALTGLAAVRKISSKRVTGYANGAVKSSGTYVNAVTTSTGAFYIGGKPAGSNLFYGGIDEVKVYSRALNPRELQLDHLGYQ